MICQSFGSSKNNAKSINHNRLSMLETIFPIRFSLWKFGQHIHMQLLFYHDVNPASLGYCQVLSWIYSGKAFPLTSIKLITRLLLQCVLSFMLRIELDWAALFHSFGVFLSPIWVNIIFADAQWKTQNALKNSCHRLFYLEVLWGINEERLCCFAITTIWLQLCSINIQWRKGAIISRMMCLKIKVSFKELSSSGETIFHGRYNFYPFFYYFSSFACLAKAA